MAGLDHVQINVLPVAGPHVALAEVLRVRDFEDPGEPDVVCVESHVGAFYLGEPAQVEQYR